MKAGRRAGLLLPLFSLRSARDWGIGEIGDLGAFCTWVASAGHRWLQLLPIAEMTPGERSPYAALTAFAIDPIYLSLPHVEDFVAAGGEAALPADERARLAHVQGTAGIDYDGVRTLKQAALAQAFARFEAAAPAERRAAFERFRAAEAPWLDEYALFRALKERHAERAWTEWEPGLARRDPVVLAAAGLASRRRFHEYAQWLASEQWAAARATAQRVGVALGGDLPFGVAADSADVWARQAEFRLDASVGAPPDAFNSEGQDWGLPPCRWDVMAANDFAWLRRRTARLAALFDGCRIDHVVGLYRTWVRNGNEGPAFDPAEEAEQQALGERLLGVLGEAGGAMTLLAEDLGVIPEFVRTSLARLAIPGYRVLRWEDDDGVYRDPRAYPACSVATTGTHDTSTLATWWSRELTPERRTALARVRVFASLARAGASFTPTVHMALLDGLYAAGSDLVLLPFQDAYGGREQINVPATVGPANWGYRIPWTIDALAPQPLTPALRALASRHGR